VKTKNRVVCAMLGAVAVLASGAAYAAGELHIYNWSNYYPPALIDKFKKEKDIQISLDSFASEADVLSKLQAGGGGYDIVVVGHRTLATMIQQGLAAKVDADQMPNFANVAKPHDTSPSDPDREYSAPYMWGSTGFTYDSARVTGGKLDDSWKEYFEPRDELKGKMASLNDMHDVYNAAAYYLGIDKCTENPQEAQQILDLLLAQKPYLKLYSNDGTIDRMIAGEVILHMQWNGAAHRVKKELPTAVYVYPREGVTFWSDNLVVPANAPDLENAKIFLNWMMDPQNAAIATNYTGYMNAIKGSDKYLDPSLKDDPAINTPPKYADRLRGYKACSEKAEQLKDKVWTRLKS
jgi:spermidine/putrescine transport system substrate-binding protein